MWVAISYAASSFPLRIATSNIPPSHEVTLHLALVKALASSQGYDLNTVQSWSAEAVNPPSEFDLNYTSDWF